MSLDIKELTKAYEAALVKKYAKYIELSYSYSKQLSAAEDTIRDLKEQVWKLEDENEKLEDALSNMRY